MKKPVVLVITFCLIFILFLVFYFKSHNYELEYNINEFDIKESYNKDNKYYTFNIKYNNINYEVISFDKYTNKRRLIEEIKVYEENDNTCLEFSKSLVTLYPICHNSNGYSSLFYNDLSTFTLNNSYENIQISNLNDKTYLLWNYHDFIYLNSKKESKISLFSKDIYNLSLNYQLEKYLLIPDYSSDYKFDKLYVINTENGKSSSIKLRYEVYFDSYFLGNDNQNVYLYDIKSEQEYYINLKKEEIYKTSPKILVDNKWESVSNQKLKTSKLTFSNTSYFSYFLDNDTLNATFQDSNISFKVINRSVSQIIKTDGLDVYYLSEDTLYYFNPTFGEKALLKYSEWKFNNQNMIFVF